MILLYAGQVHENIVDLGNLSRISAHQNSCKILLNAQQKGDPMLLGVCVCPDSYRQKLLPFDYM